MRENMNLRHAVHERYIVGINPPRSATYRTNGTCLNLRQNNLLECEVISEIIFIKKTKKKKSAFISFSLLTDDNTKPIC